MTSGFARYTPVGYSVGCVPVGLPEGNDMSFRLKMTALVGAVVIVLSGCAGSGQSASVQPTDGGSTVRMDAAALLSRLGLAGKSGREIVDFLDQDERARPLPFKASVRANAVIVGDASGEVSVPITGDDSFYLSIAPYVSRTHDCYFHSLATCMGELVNQSVHVKITDTSGTVLVDEQVETYSNGFVGFWLPQDISGTIEVQAAGKTGSVPFTTAADAPTCLTTLQVS